MGRFMSPDPINLTNARLLNPANTLNKYAYGANNPLKYIDKDGKDITIFFEAPAGKDVGHIFLAAVNQGEGKNNGQSAMLSFGPKGGGQGFGLVSGPGQFKFPVDLRDSGKSGDMIRIHRNFSSSGGCPRACPELAEGSLAFGDRGWKAGGPLILVSQSWRNGIINPKKSSPVLPIITSNRRTLKS